jgi:hypothetical protein
VIVHSDEPSFFALLSATVLFKVPDKSCKSCDIRSKNFEIVKRCIVAPFDTENHADN